MTFASLAVYVVLILLAVFLIQRVWSFVWWVGGCLVIVVLAVYVWSITDTVAMPASLDGFLRFVDGAVRYPFALLGDLMEMVRNPRVV